MDFADERDDVPIVPEEGEEEENEDRENREVQIQTAPLLTFLKAPPKPTCLLRPFKMPEGAVAIDPSASLRSQLGGRRRVKSLTPGGFKRHTIVAPGMMIGPTPEELALIAENAAKEEASRLSMEAEAENAAAMGRIAMSLPPKLPDGYEPLILHLAASSISNNDNKTAVVDSDAMMIPSSSSSSSSSDAISDMSGGGSDVKHLNEMIERDVIVEDVMGIHLRQHQREGVSFLFDCIHGKKGKGINGAILADDMGLGKTLQSIALLYTCLRQGIYRDRPTAKRAIVVCPTSLVNNWAAEIKKWLGERIRPLALAEVSRDEAVRDITAFLSSNVFPVLIISYETFRIHADRFHASEGSCDLLICDEAHRLKNEATLTTQALGKLKCLRRILLSGTPMQNDLDEFFAMVDFSNPGILGDVSHFRRKFAVPILTGREPSATDKQQRSGEEASNELSSIVNKFILRRTNSLLSQHLPPKLLQVVCVKMTEIQKKIYLSFLNSVAVANVVAGSKGKGVLGSILALKKLVNHPRLVHDVVRSKMANQSRGERLTGEAAGFQDCMHLFPKQWDKDRTGSYPDMSGKFWLATKMLEKLRGAPERDRIVIVSCYTQTLDLFQSLCSERRWPTIRLDGSTAPGKRQKLVDQFNDPSRDEFVFLLSSKAGGCGLNLIGGNRLILFDPDWNPATDLQAAARVWRDGQRKRVYVYRFLAAGTLEEKIFQRQLSKKGLQTIVVEEAEEATSLSTEDLRNLFQYEEGTPSDTHDTLRCTRCRKDEIDEGGSDEEIADQKTSGKSDRSTLTSTAGVKTALAASTSAANAAALLKRENDAILAASVMASAAVAAAVGGEEEEEEEVVMIDTVPTIQSIAASTQLPSASTSSLSRIKLPSSSSSSSLTALAKSSLSAATIMALDDDTASTTDNKMIKKKKTVVGSASAATDRDAPTPPHSSTIKGGVIDVDVDNDKAMSSSSSDVLMNTLNTNEVVDITSTTDEDDNSVAAVAAAGATSLNPKSRGKRGGGGGEEEKKGLVNYAEIDDGDDDNEDFGRKKKKSKKQQRSGGENPSSSSSKRASAGGGGGGGGKIPSKAAAAKSARDLKAQEKAFEAQFAAAFRESRLAKLADVEPGTHRRQLKQPADEDLLNWSHHCGVAGLEKSDPVLFDVGGDLVSFVFGLEVPGRDLKELNAALDVKLKEKKAADAAEQRAQRFQVGNNAAKPLASSSSSSSSSLPIKSLALPSSKPLGAALHPKPLSSSSALHPKPLSSSVLPRPPPPSLPSSTSSSSSSSSSSLPLKLAPLARLQPGSLAASKLIKKPITAAAPAAVLKLSEHDDDDDDDDKEERTVSDVVQLGAAKKEKKKEKEEEEEGTKFDDFMSAF